MDIFYDELSVHVGDLDKVILLDFLVCFYGILWRYALCIWWGFLWWYFLKYIFTIINIIRPYSISHSLSKKIPNNIHTNKKSQVNSAITHSSHSCLIKHNILINNPNQDLNLFLTFVLYLINISLHDKKFLFKLVYLLEALFACLTFASFGLEEDDFLF